MPIIRGYIYKLDSNGIAITTSCEVLRCPQTCLSTKMKTFSGCHSTDAFFQIKAGIKHYIISTLWNKGYYLLYVGSTVTVKAMALPFLALGCFIFQRSDPAAVVDCWLLLFSLNWRTAIWVLKWQKEPWMKLSRVTAVANCIFNAFKACHALFLHSGKKKLHKKCDKKHAKVWCTRYIWRVVKFTKPANAPVTAYNNIGFWEKVKQGYNCSLIT